MSSQRFLLVDEKRIHVSFWTHYRSVTTLKRYVGAWTNPVWSTRRKRTLVSFGLWSPAGPCQPWKYRGIQFQFQILPIFCDTCTATLKVRMKRRPTFWSQHQSLFSWKKSWINLDLIWYIFFPSSLNWTKILISLSFQRTWLYFQFLVNCQNSDELALKTWVRIFAI